MKVDTTLLYQQVTSANILDASQSCFRPGKSKGTALLVLKIELLMALDGGHNSKLLLLNSAAFGTINHNVLHAHSHDIPAVDSTNRNGSRNSSLDSESKNRQLFIFPQTLIYTVTQESILLLPLYSFLNVYMRPR